MDKNGFLLLSFCAHINCINLRKRVDFLGNWTNSERDFQYIINYLHEYILRYSMAKRYMRQWDSVFPHLNYKIMKITFKIEDVEFGITYFNEKYWFYLVFFQKVIEYGLCCMFWKIIFTILFTN